MIARLLLPLIAVPHLAFAETRTGVLCHYAIVTGVISWSETCAPDRVYDIDQLRSVQLEIREFVKTFSNWSDNRLDAFEAQQYATGCEREDISLMSRSLLDSADQYAFEISIFLSNTPEVEWGTCL